MIQTTCILFCRCGAGVISSEKVDQLAAAFHQLDANVYELSDLCALAVHEKDVLEAIANRYTCKIIVACYPRAVKNMFRQVAVELDDFEVLNFKVLAADQILDKLKKDYQLVEGKARYQIQLSELKVPAWFPVIDESLCTLCGQCARFCLFGVYAYNKKSLTVVNPLACKNNCPACGRTCPASAIMFPRLAEKSVLAGADPAQKGEVSSGEKEGLFVLLNERNQRRKSIFKQGVVRLAEEERRKALQEFKKGIEKGK
ncbi:ATP-binding protein [Sunxiuqinia sp. sy24]|uniref:ATP-binding protein n=1 Tax=Sunxiuqinia sp. sy24 TaxID=3461495 RepID=UPI0040459775